MRKPIAGLLNQKIEIISFEDIDDGAAGSIPVPEVYWSTTAEVKQLKSSRQLQANQETLKPSFSFTVRYRDDKFLNVDMQVKWRNHLFAIQSAEPDFVYRDKLVIIGMAIELPQR